MKFISQLIYPIFQIHFDGSNEEQKKPPRKEMTNMNWQSFADGLIVSSIVWAIAYVITITKL